MRNDISPFERFSKLLINVGKLVMEGRRDANQVAMVLQFIQENKEFYAILEGYRMATSFFFPKTCWHDEWRVFYAEVFGLGDLGAVLDSVVISDKQSFPYYLSWIVMIPPGLTLNQVWAKCQRRFPSYSSIGDDLDAAVTINDRTSEIAYVKYLRNNVEADEENAGISATILTRHKEQSITLLERLVLELWYNWRTGRHLDQARVTLCAGSRRSDGAVPTVSFSGDKVAIFFRDPEPKVLHATYITHVYDGEDFRSRTVSDSPIVPVCPSVNLVCSAPDVIPGPVNRR